MRANVPEYEFLVPPDIEDALNLLARGPGEWRPFAGGTDLMVLFERGALAHKKFFSIRHLEELNGIKIENEFVTLGALTTYTSIQRDETLRREFPMLCRAASATGGLAIQNRGTLGGNIVNASPAADSPPALLAYGAQVELISRGGARWVDYSEFHTAYKQIDLRADELLARIRLPRPRPGATDYYRKVGTRRAQAISKVCFAGFAQIDAERVDEIRIALGSVAPVVLRCHSTENILRGQRLTKELMRAAQNELAHEIAPIDDIRSTADYRRRVAANLLEDFLVNI